MPDSIGETFPGERAEAEELEESDLTLTSWSFVDDDELLERLADAVAVAVALTLEAVVVGWLLIKSLGLGGTGKPFSMLMWRKDLLCWRSCAWLLT